MIIAGVDFGGERKPQCWIKIAKSQPVCNRFCSDARCELRPIHQHKSVCLFPFLTSHRSMKGCRSIELAVSPALQTQSQ